MLFTIWTIGLRGAMRAIASLSCEEAKRAIASSMSPHASPWQGPTPIFSAATAVKPILFLNIFGPLRTISNIVQRTFHNYACRSMCRITMAHTIRHHIKSKTLHQRLGLHSVDRYYHNRLLQWYKWGGHIARMSMDRLPRMILTGWVAHPRPTGCPR